MQGKSNLLPKCSWYNYLILQPREESSSAHPTGSVHSVLFSLGCHAVYHRLGSLNNRRFVFSTVLEARSPRWRCRPIQFLVRTLFLACRGLCPHVAFFLCVCAGQGGGSYLSIYQIRATPLWPHLTLITTKRPHLQIQSRWGSGLQRRNLGGGGGTEFSP